MVIVVNKLVFERIVSFYNNVARKYKHTYDFSLMRKINKMQLILSIELRMDYYEERLLSKNGKGYIWLTLTNGTLHIE